MLKNLDPLLTPELLTDLAEMGHGDELGHQLTPALLHRFRELKARGTWSVAQVDRLERAGGCPHARLRPGRDRNRQDVPVA
jgi:hypothetical protein